MQPSAAPKSTYPGPLDYNTSALLQNDFAFRGRVRVACLHFATYVRDEATSVPAHTTRYRWSQECFQNPDMKAQAVQPIVVMDPNVQSQGDAISDSELQSATEVAIQSFL